MDISGEAIVKSVYKASLLALFAIGVKSPENVEKFTASFTQALDREFLKIGLLPKPQESLKEQHQRYAGIKTDPAKWPPAPYDPPMEDVPPVKSLDDPLDKLQLITIIKVRLRKQGIDTIGQLMTRMQKEPLTAITGIKEKSATHILAALKLWNQS